MTAERTIVLRHIYKAFKMSFLFFFLTILLPFSTNAIELPPKEAGSDFIRLFETGIPPKDRSHFYYTGFGEGNDAAKQAYAEAQKKLTDKITGMQKIINTPSFTPFLFNHFEQPAGFFGRPPRYWAIYRNKRSNIQKQRDRIVSLKILAKKVKEKAEDPDEYITGAKVYYIGKNKTVFIGKTPITDLTVFTGNEKFVLKKDGFYDASKNCRIDKKKNRCIFMMTPVPVHTDDNSGCGCLILIGGVIFLFVLFVKSLKKKE